MTAEGKSCRSRRASDVYLAVGLSMVAMGGLLKLLKLFLSS